MQEFFYGCGAEAVDGAHLTVELFHQVEGAFLVRVNQHVGPVLGILRGSTENAHAAKPHTKCMKNGILGMRSKAGGRYVTKSA